MNYKLFHKYWNWTQTLYDLYDKSVRLWQSYSDFKDSKNIQVYIKTN